MSNVDNLFIDYGTLIKKVYICVRKANNMTTTILKAGTKIQGSNGSIFEIAKVSDKNVSWYVGFEFKGGSGKNTMKMTWSSIKQTNEWIEKGLWKIVE